jgi:hypothetical protein
VLENGKIRPLEMQREDWISCNKYAGIEIKIGEDEYLIMREDDVLDVVEDLKGREKEGRDGSQGTQIRSGGAKFHSQRREYYS